MKSLNLENMKRNIESMVKKTSRSNIILKVAITTKTMMHSKDIILIIVSSSCQK